MKMFLVIQLISPLCYFLCLKTIIFHIKKHRSELVLWLNVLQVNKINLKPVLGARHFVLDRATAKCATF